MTTLTRRLVRPLLTAAVAGALLTAAPVLAGEHQGAGDHLKCYKVQQQDKGTRFDMDLTPRDPRFPTENGCRIKSRPSQLCVAVSKENITPQPPGAPNGARARPYLCYKLHCPRPEKLDVTVTDQFGGPRIQQVRQVSMLCAPATQPLD